MDLYFGVGDLVRDRRLYGGLKCLFPGCLYFTLSLDPERGRNFGDLLRDRCRRRGLRDLDLRLYVGVGDRLEDLGLYFGVRDRLRDLRLYIAPDDLERDLFLYLGVGERVLDLSLYFGVGDRVRDLGLKLVDDEELS